MTSLNSICPVGQLKRPRCLGLISDGSSIIWKTVLAAYFALETEGIKDRLTPEPIAPTKTT